MLLNMMMKGRRFYSYRPGVPTGIGVGVEGLGLTKPQTDPVYGPYDRRNTVRGDLGPLNGSSMKMVQDLTGVSIKGGGSYLTGRVALQALAEYQGG